MATDASTYGGYSLFPGGNLLQWEAIMIACRGALTTDIATVETKGNYDVSRLNALQHGILSRHAVLPWEDRGEYDTLVQQLEEEYAPQGVTEHHLIAELAGIIWRKARLRGAEKAAYLQRLNDVVHDEYSGSPIKAVLLESEKAETEAKDAVNNNPEETLREIENTKALLDACNKVLAILDTKEESAYRQALAALPGNAREVWPTWFNCHTDKYDSDSPTYQDNSGSLAIWVEGHVEEYERTIRELENRQAIKEQAIGQAFLVPDKIEPLNRYETHLDRKFERILSMLVKLQDIRKASNQLPAI